MGKINKDNYNKIHEILIELYDYKNPDLEIVKSTEITKSLGRNIYELEKTSNYSAPKTCKNIRFRLLNICCCLKTLDHKKDTKNLNKYLEKTKILFAKKIDTLAKFNVKQYDVYAATERDPISFDELLDRNKANKYKYLYKGDITTILAETLIPSRIREDIKEILPAHHWDAYPEARRLHRHFIIHAGGTNTGKTYQSLERLKQVKSGAYLSPLRLLAMEVQDNLNNSGVKCSLLTGEEEDKVEGANHIASTVEMANFNKYYEVVVIDECQMLEDEQRGGNWTEAIMGMQSPEIHLCMAPSAIKICEKIIEDCGDTYEVIEHERFVPLQYEQLKGGDFNLKKDVRDGDALIVFSRKSVLKLAADLHHAGKNASVVYGALPYESRKEQVKQFLEKKNSVVVATDAIGMGLNLPIHRVVFMEVEKFDGTIVRPLMMEEIKQIAGRAGRRGMYNEGFVSTVANSRYFARALTEPHHPISFCYVNFPESLIDIDGKLEDIMRVWYEMSRENKAYLKQSIDRTINLINKLKKKNIDKHTLYNLCTIPFDETSVDFTQQWLSYCHLYLNGETELPKPEFPSHANLQILEDYYKMLGLYFGFSKKMKMNYDIEWLKRQNHKTCEEINKYLLTEKKEVHECLSCGRTLPWNFKFKYCEKCYSSFHKWDDYY